MKLVIVLLFVALIVAAIVWWRALLRQRADHIDRYPYAKFLDKRLAARRPELSAAQRTLVFEGLREYFQLCREAGNRLVAMPSQAVDDAWHEFILFTRQYQQFCERGLGRFLHHTPAEAMRAPTDAQDGIKRAWRLACKREGSIPASRHRCRGFLRSTRCWALPAVLSISSIVLPLHKPAPAQASVPDTSVAAAAAAAAAAAVVATAGGRQATAVVRRLRWRRRLIACAGAKARAANPGQGLTPGAAGSDAVLLHPCLQPAPAIFGFLLAVAGPVVGMESMRRAFVNVNR